MSSFEDIRVDELIPEQLRETAQNLIDFLKVYYTEDNNPTHFIDFITKNRDLDQITDEKFIDALANTIAKGIPSSSAISRTFLLKRLVDNYNLKGTEKSIHLFFQLFYDRIIEVTYPWEKVFETSSANYNKNYLIRIRPSNNVDVNDLINKKIQQKNELGVILAEGFVNRITIENYEEKLVSLHFEPKTTSGLFLENEKIYYDGVEYGESYRSLKEVIVKNSSSGFEIGDIISLEGEDSSTFYLNVRSVNSRGELLFLDILERGSGNGFGLKDFVRGSNPRALKIRKKKTSSIQTISATDLELDFIFDVLVTDVISDIKNKSLLSSNIVLQDGRYYDKFSYDIQSNIHYTNYIDAYNKLIHPAGFSVFANLKIETTPPVNFKPNLSLNEINSLDSTVFQPGGSGFEGTRYGSDIENSSPDEVFNASPFGFQFRDNYSFNQSPLDSNTILKPIYGNENNSTPKAYYFFEDYVSADSPIPRILNVRGGSDSLIIGDYKPGSDLSPSFINSLNDFVPDSSPWWPHNGKINGHFYYFKERGVDTASSPVCIIYRPYKNSTEWKLTRQLSSTGFLDRSSNTNLANLQIPPQYSWSDQLSGAVLTYENIVKDDGFVTKFR